MIKRQRAIILSMTPQERRNPDILKASRKRRIAAGAGAKVEEINRLLKQHRQMADMMKAMGGAKRGPMGKMAEMFGLGGGGGLPGGMPSAEQIAEMQKQMGGGAAPKLPDAPPPGAFSAPPKLPGLPSGLPGLGGPKLPGLGGLPNFNPFGKKK